MVLDEKLISCQSTTYEILEKVGSGTYGEVFKATAAGLEDEEETVAVKRIRVTQDNALPGLCSAWQEIAILRTLPPHENVVRFIDSFEHLSEEESSSQRCSDLYIVLEFCPQDLRSFFTCHGELTNKQIKDLMRHLLSGLWHLHQSGIIHGDIKPSNILLTEDHVLKLADFGLASWVTNTPHSACQIASLSYRAPELLLCDFQFGPAIDLWSAGCVMGDMVSAGSMVARALTGKNEKDQLQKIVRLCGSINEETYPGCSNLILFPKMNLSKNKQRKVKSHMRKYWTNEEGLGLLDQLLVCDPKQRIASAGVLSHAFFGS